jgi:hypothetical protein
MGKNSEENGLSENGEGRSDKRERDLLAIAANSLGDRKLRTESTSSSRMLTVDVASLARVLKEAYGEGAAESRQTIDTIRLSLTRAEDRNDRLGTKVEELTTRLMQVAEQNIALTLLEGQARLDQTKVRETHETLRSLIANVAPAAGPAVAALASKLTPLLGPIQVEPGDKTPKACGLRLIAKLQDGSEESVGALDILATLAGEDWPGVLQFLAELAST